MDDTQRKPPYTYLQELNDQVKTQLNDILNTAIKPHVDQCDHTHNELREAINAHEKAQKQKEAEIVEKILEASWKMEARLESSISGIRRKIYWILAGMFVAIVAVCSILVTFFLSR